MQIFCLVTVWDICAKLIHVGSKPDSEILWTTTVSGI